MAMITDEELNRILAAEHPAAQERTPLTMEYLKRAASGIPKATVERPSRFGSVARGFVQRGGELVSGLGDIAYKASLAPGARTGVEFDSEPGVERDISSGMSDLGALPATDDTGRALETAGEWVFDAAATAPLVGLGAVKAGINPVMAVLAEMGAAGFGGFGESLISDAGYDKTGLGIGSVLAMAGAPIAGGGRVATTAGRKAYNAVSKMTDEARIAGKQLQVSNRAMVEGSGEIKRRIADEERFLEALDKNIARTEGLPGSVNSRQIADTMPNDRGGGAFAHMDDNLSRTDTEYSRKRTRDRADFLDALGKRWDNVSSTDPDFQLFIEKYDEGANLLKEKERALWREVMDGEQPRFSNEAMRAKAQKIVDTETYKRDDIPKVLRDILDSDITPGDSMSLTQFQDLRSSLLGVVRDAKYQPTSSNKNASRMASDVLDAMTDSIADFERLDLGGKSSQYKAARKATLDNAMLYDPKSTVITQLESGGTPKSLFSRVRNAKGRRGYRTDPENEAKRLVRIAEQTPGGMENLRALAIDDLFAEGLNPTATRIPSKTLKTNEKAYRAILGDQYDEAIELLDLSYLGTRGKGGTAAQSASVGSGVSPAKFLFGVARATTNPVQAAVEGAMTLAGKATMRELEWQKIVRTALEEPRFMRVLLKMPTKRTLPAWQVEWAQLVRKAGVRSGGRAAFRGTKDEASGSVP